MRKNRWKVLYITVIIVLSVFLIYYQILGFVENMNISNVTLQDIDIEKGHIEINVKKVDCELIDVYINGKRYENINGNVKAYVYEGDYVYLCSKKLWESELESEIEVIPSDNIMLEYFAKGVIIKKRGG